MRLMLACLLIGLAYLCSAYRPAWAGSSQEATPTQCLKSYLTALYHARDVSQLAPYFTRARQSQLKAMTAAQKSSQLKEFKKQYIGNPKFLAEKINGKKAEVKAKGIGMTGRKTYNADLSVTLLREDGYWRVSAAKISGIVKL